MPHTVRGRRSAAQGRRAESQPRVGCLRCGTGAEARSGAEGAAAERAQRLGGRPLQSTQAGKPRVAYLIIKRLLIRMFCAIKFQNLFKCYEIL